MQFHEIRFPAALSFGSMGGPERRTDIVTLSNGYEERNTPWAHSRRRYDAGVGLRAMDDVDEVLKFFEARRGQMFAFRWKDWSDFKSCKPSETVAHGDQTIGFGNGITTEFQLTKTYRSGEESYTRNITKPVSGSVLVSLAGDPLSEGVHFEVDLARGVLIFERAPDEDREITAGYEYDVPVRFDADRIHTSAASFQAGEVPSIPMVEVRL
ncbi:phage distal tail protein, Rcc01695 family [Planktotalea sp.]|uniref:phage distal tail protein, Rcc01695 family n=1 Tax=Planktotalea sp. TaxID=2029877 RepID=UPI003F6B2B38